LIAAGGLLILYFWLRLSLFPVMDGQPAGPRLKIMIGGRLIIYRALWGMTLELLLLLIGYRFFAAAGVPDAVLARNAVCGVVLVLLLLANGILRIFFTSRRLSIVLRVVMLLTMWVPVVNLVVLWYACRLVYEEYDFACHKRDVHLTRADSDLCKTKYPLVMVHGVLFRDLKYFNYWGRVPKELTRYGATVHYGNQEAVGTVERNGRDIRDKVLRVLEETGCEKVNIIAHSKGGLDARYAVSTLGLADKVASLTAIGVPHRGCRFIDMACGLIPESLYRRLANLVDSTFRKLGDENPDFYTAIRQFRTRDSEELSRQMPDAPGVYYQSYMSKMKSPLSDPLLALPYLIIYPLEGENDGLVSTQSANWGDYKGMLAAKGQRGVSHGDIIDLKREDYKGFDVLEAYISIVSDLKNLGF